MEDLQNSIDHLTNIVENIQNKLDGFENIQNEVKTTVNVLKQNVYDNFVSLNSREQYTRNWCIRVNGLKVDPSLITKFGVDGAVMRTVYNRIILPVLSHTTPEVIQEKNLNTIPQLEYVPDCFSLLENGHFLRSRRTSNQSDDRVILPDSIIIRFKSRYMRNLFLRLKNKHMPEPTENEKADGIQFYSCVPDLTAINYKLLSSLRKDVRVFKVWSIDGKIKFTLKDDVKERKTVHQVQNIMDTTEDIITAACNSMQRPVDTAASSPSPSYSTVTRSGTRRIMPAQQRGGRRAPPSNTSRGRGGRGAARRPVVPQPGHSQQNRQPSFRNLNIDVEI